MTNKIYITDPNNNLTLTPAALAQITPSSTKLPTASQFPAATIIDGATGQSVGVSGYAYGYASIVANVGYYDTGSTFFGTNVSDLTIHQITTALNGNTVPIFGAVQINLTTLNSLIANNQTLYSNITVFSPDIQSAMMTDLAVSAITSDDIVYAKSTLGLPGISDALAYYAANFSIDPMAVLVDYNSSDTTTTMGSTFTILATAPAAVQAATIYAVVNGAKYTNGGLGLFQGFNSWSLYPSNMSGTDSLGNYINSITIPGRGNNPGVTNNSQNPINAIGYALSKIGYITQNTLKTVLSTIGSLTSTVSGQDVSVLNNLTTEAANALALLPLSTQYSSMPSISNGNVLTANIALQTSYDAYQTSPNDPVLSSNLNIAIANFVQANTIGNNSNYSINGAFSQLDTKVLPVTTTAASIFNPFPPLSILQNSNSLTFSSNITNTSIQGMTLAVTTAIASGNVNSVASGSTMPSLVTNPTLAMITISGQSSNLMIPINVNSTFNFMSTI